MAYSEEGGKRRGRGSNNQKTTTAVVRVPIKNLNIRKGPGIKFDRIGKFTGIGEFEITRKVLSEDTEKGWGKLKSGLGWINLDFCEEIES